MTLLSVNWGFALLVVGVGMGTVFLMLVVLILLIGFQSKLIAVLTGKTKHIEEPENTTETHPTAHEQAAIAMAMHLYLDTHDEETPIITIQKTERRYSPWSSKIYQMRDFSK